MQLAAVVMEDSCICNFFKYALWHRTKLLDWFYIKILRRLWKMLFNKKCEKNVI